MYYRLLGVLFKFLSRLTRFTAALSRLLVHVFSFPLISLGSKIFFHSKIVLPKFPLVLSYVDLYSFDLNPEVRFFFLFTIFSIFNPARLSFFLFFFFLVPVFLVLSTFVTVVVGSISTFCLVIKHFTMLWQIWQWNTCNTKSVRCFCNVDVNIRLNTSKHLNLSYHYIILFQLEWFQLPPWIMWFYIFW